MRRLPGDRIVSLGEDYRQWPRAWWGSRDIADDRARAALEASRPLPTTFAPLPGPPVSLSVNPFSDPPPSSADRRRLGLPPRADLDARLKALGIQPRRKR
jgi:hypothetical protein